ncbi:hypothetical protein MUK42_14947 [Musa troglodytarum]|uniref:Uncharacterized protein n=1 Tax=Musa troglodytarum TaxID=320322 RepID=A0A9E7L959_9LILI|nr:hypothetical protein MUK42_14947 [Musa troglodytarum]
MGDRNASEGVKNTLALSSSSVARRVSRLHLLLLFVSNRSIRSSWASAAAGGGFRDHSREVKPPENDSSLVNASRSGAIYTFLFPLLTLGFGSGY